MTGSKIHMIYYYTVLFMTRMTSANRNLSLRSGTSLLFRHSCEVAKRRLTASTPHKRSSRTCSVILAKRAQRAQRDSIAWPQATAKLLNPRGGAAATRARLRAAVLSVAYACEVGLSPNSLDSRASRKNDRGLRQELRQEANSIEFSLKPLSTVCFWSYNATSWL
jgi:hypothetical protein